jgi:nitroreductase
VDSLKLLQQRVSVSKLQSPAPTRAELKEVFKAAVRAADHGKLQPWRFLVIEGAGLDTLSEVFVAAALKVDPQASPGFIDKCRSMPKRAPMIIVGVANCHDDSKVPKQEQIIACGAAVQNMLNAFFALGYGAIWRTGDMARDCYVLEKLGLNPNEEIVGFVYVGSPVNEFSKPPEVVIDDFFQVWPAE